MSDDRYQYQNRVTKLYRWLRWKPWYAAVFCLCIVKWLCHGLPLEDEDADAGRWAFLTLMWYVCMGVASARMRHLFTLDETLAELECDNG